LSALAAVLFSLFLVLPLGFSSVFPSAFVPLSSLRSFFPSSLDTRTYLALSPHAIRHALPHALCRPSVVSSSRPLARIPLLYLFAHPRCCHCVYLLQRASLSFFVGSKRSERERAATARRRLRRSSRGRLSFLSLNEHDEVTEHGALYSIEVAAA